MNQRSRIECLVTTPVTTLMLGQRVELTVNERQELIERVLISRPQLEQKLVHRVMVRVDATPTAMLYCHVSSAMMQHVRNPAAGVPRRVPRTMRVGAGGCESIT